MLNRNRQHWDIRLNAEGAERNAEKRGGSNASGFARKVHLSGTFRVVCNFTRKVLLPEHRINTEFKN